MKVEEYPPVPQGSFKKLTDGKCNGKIKKSFAQKNITETDTIIKDREFHFVYDCIVEVDDKP